jgi:PEP-CTERM motif
MKSAFKFSGIVAAALCFAAPSKAATIINTGTAGTTGATALYVTANARITSNDPSFVNAQASRVDGVPDDRYTGLGSHYIQFDLNNYRFIDGLGQDFNVYEWDGGVAEFRMMNVLVSANGVNFFNVNPSAQTALDLAGDEMHSNANFRRSYDLTAASAALGTNQFRYLRLDGIGTGSNSGATGGARGFDLDAVGFGSFLKILSPVPEPATWLMMLFGLLAIGSSMRRRPRSSKHLQFI